MEKYRVIIDGEVFTVPKSKVGSQAEAERVVREYLGSQPAPVTQTRTKPQRSGPGDLLAGLSQGVSLGASDEILGRAEAFLRNVPSENTIARRRDDVAQAAARNPLGFFGAELIGSVPTTLGLLAGARRGAAAPQAAGAAIKTGKTAANLAKAGRNILKDNYGRATAVGGAEGAIAGFNTGEGDTAQRAAGAALGGVFGAGLGAASQFVQPRITDTAKKLAEYGIPFSPASLGKGGKALEQSARQVPFIGGQFRKLKEDKLRAFNTATVNQVLKPIGVRATEPVSGQDAFDFADKQIVGAYDRILGEAGEFNIGTTATELLGDGAKTLSKKDRKALLLDLAEIDELMPGGQTNGKNFKEVDSLLRRIIEDYRAGVKSTEGATRRSSRKMLDIITGMRERLLDLAAASVGGDFATDLRAADFSYKMLQVLKNLAERPGAQEMFTPAQLQRAIATVFKKDGKDFARGKAPIQEFANLAGEELTDLEYSTARDTAAQQLLTNVPGGVASVLAGLGAYDIASDQQAGLPAYGAGAGLGLLALASRPGIYRRLPELLEAGGTVPRGVLTGLTPMAGFAAGNAFNQGNN